MHLDTALFDALTAQAKVSPRLRTNFDLRNSPTDQSQRMLNALEPGTVMPIHSHRNTSETDCSFKSHNDYYLNNEHRYEIHHHRLW